VAYPLLRNYPTYEQLRAPTSTHRLERPYGLRKKDNKRSEIIRSNLIKNIRINLMIISVHMAARFLWHIATHVDRQRRPLVIIS
jgi:hypothetical protein